MDHDGSLSLAEFAVAMHCISAVESSVQLPVHVPHKLRDSLLFHVSNNLLSSINKVDFKLQTYCFFHLIRMQFGIDRLMLLIYRTDLGYTLLKYLKAKSAFKYRFLVHFPRKGPTLTDNFTLSNCVVPRTQCNYCILMLLILCIA